MEFYDHISKEEILNDWNEIRAAAKGNDELETIQRIIARVCSRQLDMYKAYSEVEKLYPGQNAIFSRFMLKFQSLSQDLPESQKTMPTLLFYLKMVNLNADNPENPVELPDMTHITRLFDMAGNVLIKDLLENAENLYPNDGNSRKMGARDLLDGLVMSAEPESKQFKERAFLKMKQKLINLAGESVSDFEKKLFTNEKTGISLYPNLYMKPEGL